MSRLRLDVWQMADSIAGNASPLPAILKREAGHDWRDRSIQRPGGHALFITRMMTSGF
jgi:hypothetical protein